MTKKPDISRIINANIRWTVQKIDKELKNSSIKGQSATLVPIGSHNYANYRDIYVINGLLKKLKEIYENREWNVEEFTSTEPITNLTYRTNFSLYFSK